MKTDKSDVYGILFGGGGFPYTPPELGYFSLDDRKTYFLAEAWETNAILATGEEVYYDDGPWGSEVIKSLFGGFKSSHFHRVEAVQEHRDKILGSGACGLINILKEGEKLITKTLITEEKMKEEKSILSIKSLLVDQEENLFGLVAYKEYKDERCGLIKIEENSGKYSLGEEILSYGKKSQRQADIIPQGILKGKNDKDYNFSVISCGDSKYLDLNGEKIRGTEVEYDHHIIKRVKFLGMEAGNPFIFYLDRNFGQVVKTRIDLKNKEVIEKDVLICGLSVHINYALEPVSNHSLHEKLIKWAETQKKI